MPLSSGLAERCSQPVFSQKVQKRGVKELENTVKDFKYDFYQESVASFYSCRSWLPLSKAF